MEDVIEATKEKDSHTDDANRDSSVQRSEINVGFSGSRNSISCDEAVDEPPYRGGPRARQSLRFPARTSRLRGGALLLLVPFAAAVDGALHGGSAPLAAAAALLGALVAAFAPAPALRRARVGRLLAPLGVALLAALAAAAISKTALLVAAAFLPLVALGRRGAPLSATRALHAPLAAVAAVSTRYDALLALAPRRPSGGASPVLRGLVVLGALALFAPPLLLANPFLARGAGALIARVALGPALVHGATFTGAMLGGIFLVKPAGFAAEPSPLPASAAPLRAEVHGLLKTLFHALAALFALFLVVDVVTLAAVPAVPGVGTQLRAHAGVTWLAVTVGLAAALTAATLRPGPLAALPEDARAAVVRPARRFLALTAGVAAVASARVALHIAASGLSDLRLFGLFGIAGALFGIVALARRLRGRDGVPYTDRWLARRLADAVAAPLVAYLLTPTHLVSAAVDVALIEGGRAEPLLHVRALAEHPESYPYLVRLLHHRDRRVKLVALTALDHGEPHGDRGGAPWLVARGLEALDGAAEARTILRRSVDVTCLDGAILDLTTQVNFLGDAAAVAEDPWLWARCSAPAADGTR